MSHELITATQLAQKAHVSKETGNQIALVTDPYHDFPLVACGYPDGRSVFSVIKRRSGRTTITCPFVLAVGETWDFHVFTTPLHDYKNSPLGVYSNGGLLNNAGGFMTIGPVNIICRHYNSAGTALNAVHIPFNGVVSVGDNMSQIRTVSLGFEVHDVSPMLDKQGSISVYRVNEPPRSVYGVFGTSPATSFPHDYLGGVPSNLSELTLNPTFRTWELEHGTYCVALPSHNNDYHAFLRSNFVLQIPIGFGTDTCIFTNVVSSSDTVSWSPLLSVGAMSSRLTSSTLSYVVDFRQVVEMIPSVGSPTMLYANTAPEYNSQFLKLYKRMLLSIPPGTKVGNNDSGDWFRFIANAARTLAPLVVNALPPQLKTVAALAAPLANHALDKLEQKITNKKTAGTKAPTKKNG